MPYEYQREMPHLTELGENLMLQVGPGLSPQSEPDRGQPKPVSLKLNAAHDDKQTNEYSDNVESA